MKQLALLIPNNGCSRIGFLVTPVTKVEEFALKM